MKLLNKKINFLGDSITEGCGTSGPDAFFTTLIKRNHGLAEAKNYGIGGTRIARQTVSSPNPITDMDFCLRMCVMEKDADAVVVFGGTNDFGHGDAPIGQPSDRTPYTYYGACHVLCQGLKELFPNSVIAIVTPLHRCGENSPKGDGSRTTVCPPLSEYVRILKEVAEDYNLPVLDLFSAGILDPNDARVKTELVPDGLHPNDEGHKILAEKIAEFLISL